jgi:hypothetical protein
MLDALVGANSLQRTTAARFADRDAEDRYYRSHEPRHRRFDTLARLAVVVGLLALVIDVAPR